MYVCVCVSTIHRIIPSRQVGILYTHVCICIRMYVSTGLKLLAAPWIIHLLHVRMIYLHACMGIKKSFIFTVLHVCMGICMCIFMGVKLLAASWIIHLLQVRILYLYACICMCKYVSITFQLLADHSFAACGNVTCMYVCVYVCMYVCMRYKLLAAPQMIRLYCTKAWYMCVCMHVCFQVLMHIMHDIYACTHVRT